MVPQQAGYPTSALLPAYPHPGFPPNAGGPGFPPNAGPGFPQPQGLPVQVGIPVGGHSMNPLPPFPVGHQQQPLPNASSNPAFGCNMPGSVVGQAVHPYPSPAPNVMNGMQPIGANNVSGVPGQQAMHPYPSPTPNVNNVSVVPGQQAVHPYASPAPNVMNGMQTTGANNISVVPGQQGPGQPPPSSHHPNAPHHTNPPAQWQGQPTSSPAPCQPGYPSFTPCMPAPRQNFIPVGPGAPNQYPQLQASGHGFPQQEHAGGYAHLPPSAGPNAFPPNLQFPDSNGTAVGLPVMGTPVYMNGTQTIPCTTFQGQQPGQLWQQLCSENPAMKKPAPQSAKNHFSLTKYYRGNHPHLLPALSPETQPCANGGQPLYSERVDRPQHGPFNERTGYPSLAMQQNSYACYGRGQEVMQCTREESQFNGACSQQESQSSSIEQVRKEFSRSNHDSSDYGGDGQSKGKERRSDRRHLRCDPCERTFTNASQLDAHISSHVKCEEEGCTYEASGKMIKEHKVVEHGKISIPTTCSRRKSLAMRSRESEEEISLWREERKNNYPTSANILRKVEEMKIRKEKGEFFDKDGQKRRQRLREILARQKELGVLVAEIPARYLFEPNKKWQKPSRNARNIEGEGGETGKMVAVLADDSNLTKSQSQDLAGSKRPCPTANGPDVSYEKKLAKMPLMQKAPSLVVSKAGDGTPQHFYSNQNDKQSEGSVQDELASKAPDVGADSVDIRLQQHFSSDQNDGQTDFNKPSHLFQRQEHCRKGSRSEFVRRRRRKKQQCDSDLINEKRPSLLAKLLQSDIERDRSHLLQCFRFIVNNSFLQEYPTAPSKFFECTRTEGPPSAEKSTVDGLVASGVCESMPPDSQESEDERGIHDSFVSEPPNRELLNDIHKFSVENVVGEVDAKINNVITDNDEVDAKINDVITDNDEDGMLQYMNLDFSGTDSAMGPD